jgi:photosystem II stability/assembly factor-like uncharacterized protein
MTRFLTVVTAIVFYALPLFSQNTWVKQTSGYSENFKKVVFTDSVYGWIAGDSGIILNTTNGGNNWSAQMRNPNNFLVDIFFLNRLYGWSIAWRALGTVTQSLIYSTTNGGNNWTYFEYPDSLTLLNTVYFLNPNTGFLGCIYTSTRTILRTTNGGANWFPATVDTNFGSNFPARIFKFTNSSTGYAAGGYKDVSGVVWKTTDGGVNWLSKAIGGESFSAIDFNNSGTIIITGGDYEYGVSAAYSTDEGNNWNYDFTGFFGIGYSMSFRTNTEGWITSGFSQMFLKTTDSGGKWDKVPTPNNTSVYSVTFTNQRTGWAVGDSGTILKFTGTPIGIYNQNNIQPDKTSLLQNYPNPFNPTTVICYQLSVASDVTLKVYDVQGREVKTLVKKRSNAGTYEVKFDGTGLTSGVYFYSLNADGKVVHTRKMVVLK